MIHHLKDPKSIRRLHGAPWSHNPGESPTIHCQIKDPVPRPRSLSRPTCVSLPTNLKSIEYLELIEFTQICIVRTPNMVGHLPHQKILFSRGNAPSHFI